MFTEDLCFCRSLPSSWRIYRKRTIVLVWQGCPMMFVTQEPCKLKITKDPRPNRPSWSNIVHACNNQHQNPKQIQKPTGEWSHDHMVPGRAPSLQEFTIPTLNLNPWTPYINIGMLQSQGTQQTVFVNQENRGWCGNTSSAPLGCSIMKTAWTDSIKSRSSTILRSGFGFI